MLSKMNRAVTALVASFFFLFSFITTASAKDGTDGTELQIVSPEQLTIQLGPEWTGVEFRLKTDSGLYPGTIPVGEDGVLRLEIGGSTSYTLTCLGSEVSAPVPEEESVPLSSVPPEAVIESHSHEPEPESEAEPAVAGIPIWQLCVFGGGMVVAISALVILSVMKRRRGEEADEEDDEYE